MGDRVGVGGEDLPHGRFDRPFVVDAREPFGLHDVGRRTTEFGERYSGGPRDGELVRVPSYTEVDLRAGVDIDRFRLEAFAQNLFDKRGITDAFGFPDPVAGDTFPNSAAGVAIIRPRTIGLTATVNY